ncbi:hypothetical protein [Burkholderia paludis]|uniref:hypothetical protein n=1 Tax=Burkholderia paludis TaxID=1506587 RepID=UPI00126A4886|nr:hypothetical protein [Burkholderia paludis]
MSMPNLPRHKRAIAIFRIVNAEGIAGASHAFSTIGRCSGPVPASMPWSNCTSVLRQRRNGETDYTSTR